MTWFRCGGGSGIPASLKTKMNNVLNKKFGTSIDYPADGWPDDVDLLGLLEEKTASGSIVTFSDGADDVPLKSCEVALPASLDGYTGTSVVQTGKNLLNDSIRGRNVNNIFFGHDTGTQNDFSVRLRAGTYIFSVVTADGTATNLYVKNSDTNTNITGFPAYNSLSKTFTLTEDTNCAVFAYKSGYTDVTDILTAQIEVGSTASTYEPYVAPTTHTATLGRTIYGGQPDIVKGEGTDGCAKDSMTSTYLSGLSSSYIGYEASTNYFGGHPTIWVRNWNYQTAKIRQAGGIGCACDYFPVSMHNTGIINTQNRIYFDVNGKGISDVAGFIAFVQNLEANNESLDIVYELETPTDFTFSPVEINSRLGDNTMWSDGDMSVVYRASGTVTPIQPTLITKNITANGTYSASDDGADGYSEVVVNISSAVSTDPIMSANAFVTKSGVSGTDTSTVARSFTMSAAGKLIFASGTYGFTNTGSNDGYFEIQKNGVSVVKQYCNTSTNTPIAIPEIPVEENDVVDLVVGFDNAHSNCNFQFYSAMVVVSEV